MSDKNIPNDKNHLNINDESLFSADKKSGLGTHIFNLASDGRWSIKRVGSTTEFRLTMTLES